MSDTEPTPEGDNKAAPKSTREPELAVPPPSKPPPTAENVAEAIAIDDPEPVRDPAAEAKADAQRFRDQLLRTAADFDNYRKRARREQEDAQRRGKESTLKELLPVFDNLERATVSAETASDAKSVADGLRMVGKQFSNALDKLGIKRVPTIGIPFDPMLHEAIQHIESKEHVAGVIAAEVQAGYLIGEHLLRAAMVVVSKGAPSSAEASGETASSAAAPKDTAAKDGSKDSATSAGDVVDPITDT